MKKILLCTGEENAFDQNMTMFKCNDDNYQIDLVKMFSSEKKIDKVKRNLGKFFMKEQISDELKKDLSSYDCVIFFECTVKNYAIEFIRKNNPDLRIIIYFRNKFSYSKKRNLSLKFLEKNNCEFWSYNKEDCCEKNFKYNSQFWNTGFYNKINLKSEVENDIIFLGRIKNREKKLRNLHNICKKENLKSYIYLVPKSEFEFDKNFENKYMDYLEYLDKVVKSNVIIDLVNEKNYGLTIRPLEAIFLKKKLITNYKEITTYDFYNPKNVFIIEDDSINGLQDFLKKEYEEIDQTIIKKYDFKEWIKNFFEEEEY